MALLHRATITPSKADLIAAWLPAQPWYDGVTPVTPRPVAGFRLDDPDGEVGIEVTLLDAGDGRVWQIASTYRAEPLDGGAGHLVGVAEHSVLGTRHVYDAVGDPVFLAVVRETISGRGHQAELVRDRGDGTSEPVEQTMTAHGTGGEGVDVVLEREPVAATDDDVAEGSATLVAEIPGRDPLVLARLA